MEEQEKIESDIKELAQRVFQVPTVSYEEQMMRTFLMEYAEEQGIHYEADDHGNIIFEKNAHLREEDDSVPCVVAHIDTVHHDQKKHVYQNRYINVHFEEDGKIWATDPISGKQTGVGGDDNAGVIIALNLITNAEIPMKAAFFASEEVGCQGSSAVDEELLNDVGYFMQFDAPYGNWISYTSQGVQLFNDEFYERIEGILDDYGQDNISRDPFTDIWQLKMKFPVNCINIFAGYENFHQSKEFVRFENMVKSYKLATELIGELGREYFYFKYEPPRWGGLFRGRGARGYGGYGGYGGSSYYYGSGGSYSSYRNHGTGSWRSSYRNGGAGNSGNNNGNSGTNLYKNYDEEVDDDEGYEYSSVSERLRQEYPEIFEEYGADFLDLDEDEEYYEDYEDEEEIGSGNYGDTWVNDKDYGNKSVTEVSSENKKTEDNSSNESGEKEQ